MYWKLFVFTFAGAILNNVDAYFENEDTVYKQEHCIKMTPAKEAEIQTIIDKIGDCLNTLAMEHEDFDIRLVQFDIEHHYEDEKEEKDTIVQVNINDCAEVKKETFTESRSDPEANSEERSKTVVHKKPHAELMTLNLDGDGIEFVDKLEKFRGRKIDPIVVYLQENKDMQEYWMLN